MCVLLPYTGGTRIPLLQHMQKTPIPRLLGVRNYLKSYSALYNRLTRSRMELASPAYLGIAII